VILVDTGPCVALFDPQDGGHQRCREALQAVREPLLTTVPVLTEAFHMLSSGSQGAHRLREFILRGGLSVWFMDGAALQRALALMAQYADHPIDLADASLIAAAEKLNTRKIFTLDRRDFAAYRVRRGHRYYGVEIVG
jgi:predicted nucleic acid-binding protein